MNNKLKAEGYKVYKPVYFEGGQGRSTDEIIAATLICFGCILSGIGIAIIALVIHFL